MFLLYLFEVNHVGISCNGVDAWKADIQAIKDAHPKPVEINDSRFGLRKFFFNDTDKPSIGIYNTPGRGPNGESQN